MQLEDVRNYRVQAMSHRYVESVLAVPMEFNESLTLVEAITRLLSRCKDQTTLKASHVPWDEP